MNTGKWVFSLQKQYIENQRCILSVAVISGLGCQENNILIDQKLINT